MEDIKAAFTAQKFVRSNKTKVKKKNGMKILVKNVKEPKRKLLLVVCLLVVFFCYNKVEEVLRKKINEINLNCLFKPAESGWEYFVQKLVQNYIELIQKNTDLAEELFADIDPQKRLFVLRIIILVCIFLLFLLYKRKVKKNPESPQEIKIIIKIAADKGGYQVKKKKTKSFAIKAKKRLIIFWR